MIYYSVINPFNNIMCALLNVVYRCGKVSQPSLMLGGADEGADDIGETDPAKMKSYRTIQSVVLLVEYRIEFCSISLANRLMDGRKGIL